MACRGTPLEIQEQHKEWPIATMSDGPRNRKNNAYLSIDI